MKQFMVVALPTVTRVDKNYGKWQLWSDNVGSNGVVETAADWGTK